MPFKKFGGTGIARWAMGIKWAFVHTTFSIFCTFEVKSKGFCACEKMPQFSSNI